jgi:signal peptidase
MTAEPTAHHDVAHRHFRVGPSPWYSILAQILAWAIAAVLFALILALVVIPRIVGAMPYTILTSSMVPTMPPGTIVVDRPVPFDSITVGTVLTYQLQSGQPAVVTHRVVGINVEADGSRTLTMRGDANPSPDAAHVISKQVRGVVWYSVPYIGYVGSFGTVDVRSIAARGVGAALILYALYVAIMALVRGRKSPKRAREEG